MYNWYGQTFITYLFTIKSKCEFIIKSKQKKNKKNTIKQAIFENNK